MGKHIVGWRLAGSDCDIGCRDPQLVDRISSVRPWESFPSDEGPQVVTAGVRNFKSASMKFAFGDHPLAWPDAIRVFVHDTALE